MKWSPTILAASLGMAAAHGDTEGQHVPRLFGARRFLSKLDMTRAPVPEGHIASARNPVYGPMNLKRPQSHNKRQDGGGTDGQCGRGYGSCDSGYCCSAEG